ncbi:MAG: 50S ribosomal protein L24 [Verrucomicrobia bacterium]|nr:50S ribosomal protein L24 [Verrucomicrobiota bacterium]MCF7707826.1 50S ribosomal protein L24 [Verrucomicrobiota bacterium]
MKKFHVKRGDEVVVISGTERGKRGKILFVLKDKNRVIVEGVKIIKKHMRKNQQHPQGAIIEREGTIHASNVMLASKYDERVARRSGKQESASS